MANVAYFSEIQKKPVFDDRGMHVGNLADLVFQDGHQFADVTGGVLDISGKRLKFDWKYVASVGPSLYLNVTKERLPVRTVEDRDNLVNEILMDRQLVDVNGLKVVRVNDVLLSKEKNRFGISGVAVGARSLLRRLGLEPLTLIALPNLKTNIVPWEFVQPLSAGGSPLGLSFSKQKINDVHPADIADLMDELSHAQRQILFNAMDEDTAAQTLSEAQPALQKSLVEHLNEKKINALLKKLSPSEIVDLFGSVSTASRVRLFSLMEHMDKKVFQKIARLLPFPDEWAGGLMKTEYFFVPDHYTIGKVRAYLKKQRDIEDFHHIYVVDDEHRLVGVLPLRDVFLKKPKTPVAELIDPGVIYVHLKDPLKKVANVFSKYHLFAVPVVDKNGKLAGIITMDDVFEEVSPKSWRKIPFFAKRVQTERGPQKDGA
ncbi:MAG: CBS domain-containing protein [Candidatus Diapherotrites archaeon]|nr:CBS domain-containing protein [Candidatus Diapherotrites archaeon]